MEPTLADTHFGKLSVSLKLTACMTFHPATPLWVCAHEDAQKNLHNNIIHNSWTGEHPHPPESGRVDKRLHIHPGEHSHQ